MPTHKTLTDAAVRKLKAKKSQQIDHFDQQYPGLAIRVSHSRKVWVYFHRLKGDPKLRRLTFDLYPTMGVAEAHDAWRKARDAILVGKDPAPPAPPAQPSPATSVGAVIEEWLRRDQADNRSVGKTRSQMSLHVLPRWGQRDIAGIGRRDALDLIDAVADRGKVVAARRLHAHLHRLFAWSVGRGIIQVNPLANVDKPGAEKSRERTLTDAELVKVWQAAKSLGHPYGTAVKLLALTGARREEISGLRWDEIVDGAIHLVGDRTKNGEQHIIPLSAPARAAARITPASRRPAFRLPRPKRRHQGWQRHFVLFPAVIPSLSGRHAMKALIYSMAIVMPYIAASSITPAQATTAPHLQASVISPLTPTHCRRVYHCHWNSGDAVRTKHCHVCG